MNIKRKLFQDNNYCPQAVKKPDDTQRGFEVKYHYILVISILGKRPDATDILESYWLKRSNEIQKCINF